MQLPIILKKEIISIDDETARLKYIGNIFKNILDNDKSTSSRKHATSIIHPQKFISIFYIIYDIIDHEGLLYLVNRYHFMELGFLMLLLAQM